MGDIQQGVTLMIDCGGRRSTHQFLVADIGTDELILGYPFFEATDPKINWAEGSLDETVTISTTNAGEWSMKKKDEPRKTSWVQSIPGWEPGDEVWV
jgi:hypothetical protein